MIYKVSLNLLKAEKTDVFNKAQGMINDAANQAAAEKKQMYMIGGGVAAILLVVLILRK